MTRPVMCLETGRRFGSVQEAARWLGCRDGYIVAGALNGYPVRGYRFETE